MARSRIPQGLSRSHAAIGARHPPFRGNVAATIASTPVRSAQLDQGVRDTGPAQRENAGTHGRDDISLGITAAQFFDGAEKRLTHRRRIVSHGVAAKHWKHLLDEPFIAIDRSNLDATLPGHPVAESR